MQNMSPLIKETKLHIIHKKSWPLKKSQFKKNIISSILLTPLLSY